MKSEPQKNVSTKTRMEKKMETRIWKWKKRTRGTRSSKMRKKLTNLAYLLACEGAYQRWLIAAIEGQLETLKGETRDESC